MPRLPGSGSFISICTSFVTDVAASSLPVTGLLRFVLTVERRRSICWTTTLLLRLPKTGQLARFLRRDRR